MSCIDAQTKILKLTALALHPTQHLRAFHPDLRHGDKKVSGKDVDHVSIVGLNMFKPTAPKQGQMWAAFAVGIAVWINVERLHDPSHAHLPKRLTDGSPSSFAVMAPYTSYKSLQPHYNHMV